MRITGNGCSLHGTEGISPPLPFIIVSDDEGRKLVEAGLAIAVDGMPVVEAPAPVEIQAVVSAVDAAEDSAPVSVGPESPSADAESIDTDDLSEIVEAFDLLEDSDLVKAGARSGRPKVSAVANVLGRDVSVDEIDAAWNDRV